GRRGLPAAVRRPRGRRPARGRPGDPGGGPVPAVQLRDAGPAGPGGPSAARGPPHHLTAPAPPGAALPPPALLPPPAPSPRPPARGAALPASGSGVSSFSRPLLPSGGAAASGGPGRDDKPGRP